MALSAPILSGESKEKFSIKNSTKLFIVDSNDLNTFIGLQEAFPNLKIQTPINTIDVFKDENTKSTLIIMNINGLEKLNSTYNMLSNIEYLESGRNYKIQ